MALNLPPPDHRRLPGASLALVVCQVRFDEQPSVREATIGKPFLTAVQDEYPTPTQLRGEQLTIGLNLPGAPETTQLKGWRAASADGGWTVSLLPDSVAVETSAFTSFEEEMAPRLARLLAVTEELISPALSERLGLRFVNLLPPLSDEEISVSRWSEAVSEAFRGPAQTPGLADGLLSLESRTIFDGGGDMKAAVRWTFGTTDRLLLDIDVFRDVSRVFSAEELVAEAQRCNDLAVQLFYAALSTDMLEKLGGVHNDGASGGGESPISRSTRI
jgi:uncharacterized protein (TIGR04255 family)